MMSNADPNKKGGMKPCVHEWQVVPASYNNKTPAFYPRNIAKPVNKLLPRKRSSGLILIFKPMFPR